MATVSRSGHKELPQGPHDPGDRTLCAPDEAPPVFGRTRLCFARVLPEGAHAVVAAENELDQFVCEAQRNVLKGINQGWQLLAAV